MTCKKNMLKEVMTQSRFAKEMFKFQENQE